MEEVWKAIEGYEGLYEVSNLGRVRSLDRYVKSPRGIRLAPSKDLSQKNTRGYKSVTLSKNGKLTTYLVHRLVVQAFIPNPFDLPQVNHRDENKSNNNVNNLEWFE